MYVYVCAPAARAAQSAVSGQPGHRKDVRIWLSITIYTMCNYKSKFKYIYMYVYICICIYAQQAVFGQPGHRKDVG